MQIPSLEQLGWQPFFAKQALEYPALKPARVSRPDLNRYHLLSPQGALIGLLPGRMRKPDIPKADLPTVGDWVLVSPAPEGPPGTVIIEHTLARSSKFSRKEAGERYDEQVVAANIDTVFLVTGLDDNFNIKRIERYLLLAWTSGANPVIVLSKCDLCRHPEKRRTSVEAIAQGAPIHLVSATGNIGLQALRDYVPQGKTAALLGSSGVGKSTITNSLLGHDYLATGEVREIDSKGRHTTTFRELCLIEGAGLLIDTPGMREIQMWADADSLAASYADIMELAMQCRFSDCNHGSEPHCAVKQAISVGTLPQARLSSFQKYQQELDLLMARTQNRPTAGTRRKPKP